MSQVAVLAQEPPSPDKPPQEVMFASYNVHNYLTMERRVKGEVTQSTKPENEKAAVVKMIGKTRADLLGICEIGTEEDVADLTARLKQAGMDFPHHTLAKAADGTRRVALLSKFPIAATNHRTDLSYPLGGERLPLQRGILDATVQVNEGYQLRVLGVHLKSKRATEEGDQAVMRRNEAHLLREHIEKILADSLDTNLLVFGDFNDTRNEAPIRAIQGAFGSDGYMKDVQAADEHGMVWTYFWDFADQYSRFDYVFVSKALNREIVAKDCFIASDRDWFTASDHRPVVVKILAEDH